MTDVLKAALEYAEQGWPVFPCDKMSKAPLVSGGFRSATVDPATIKGWWGQWPDAMIGCPTGEASGFWALDVDDPELLRRHIKIKLPKSRRHKTGKGFHLLYKYGNVEVRNTQRSGGADWPLPELPGTEVRGEGGYIIMPPSLHPSGVRYVVDRDVDLIEPSAELLAIVTKKQKPAALPPVHATNDALAYLETECAKIRNAPNGSQEATLNTAALKMGKNVAMSQLSQGGTRNALINAGLSMVSHDPRNPWTHQKITDKVDRALGDGIRTYFAAQANQTIQSDGLNYPVFPQPLLRELTEAKPYPVHALGPLSDAVQAVQQLTQAPAAIPAQSALTVAALVLQGFADVETLGGHRPLSLYALTIAVSGERKSSCDGYFMAAIRKHEAEMVKIYQQERVAWQNANEIWKSNRKDLMDQVTKGEASVDELNALAEQPVAPRSYDRVVTEPTYEGLTKLFAEGQPALGLFSDEGGQFLGGYAMSSDNRQKTMAALNDLWGGNPIKRTRQGDGAFTLSHRRLSLHLMVQPVVAAPLLADQLASGSGFLARCLLTQPQSAIGTRMHMAEQVDDGPLHEYTETFQILLRAKLKIDERTGALEVRLLRLHEVSKKLLIEFADEVEVAQRAGGKYEGITAYASKMAEQVARIAAVLTLWENVSALHVPPQYMANAIILGRYYLDEALRLVGEAQISEETSRAERLRQWLLSLGDKDVITVRDVVSRGPNSLRESSKARKAIQLLVEHGWLLPVEGGMMIDGRVAKEVWRINKD